MNRGRNGRGGDQPNRGGRHSKSREQLTWQQQQWVSHNKF
jgi:hypothetical protein